MKENTFYVMATGTSVNDITDEEWKFLEDKNTVALGAFALSGKKTKYNYSHEGIILDELVLRAMKKNGYLDTVVFLHWIKSIRYASNLGFKNIIPVMKGTALIKPGLGWFMDEEYPTIKLINCLARNFTEPMFRFRGSLSAAINVALILGAQEIRLVGVDLDCMNDFFFDIDRWAKDDEDRELIQMKLDKHYSSITQKIESRPYMYDGFNPETMHTTAIPYKDKSRWGDRQLRGMLDVIWCMDKELKEVGHRGIYVTSKKSELYKQNKVEYKSIMEDD